MAEYQVLLLPGDGIGPEVTREAARVLGAIAQTRGIAFRFPEAPIGGAAIDRVGVPMPQETLEACRAADAILFGAVGGPRWDGLPPDRRPERALFDLRRTLAVFANLRPVRAMESLIDASPLRAERVRGTDLMIVRELTGGIYFGEPRSLSEEEAVDTLRYHRDEIARVARVAFTLAQQRRRRVTSVDKANVLASSQLWRAVVEHEARQFPDVVLEHMLVDTCAMQLVRAPTSFDVILTENMFGDILSDEAAGVVGSIGLLPSASMGATPALYEPVHGSAPDIAGQGVANPLGAILSAAMMLRHSFGLDREAAIVEDAVVRVLQQGIRPPDLGGSASTVEVGQSVAAAILHHDETLSRAPPGSGNP